MANTTGGEVATYASVHKTFKDDILDLPRALMGGTREMRNKGVKYLPKETEEKTEAYTSRLNRSILLNAFERTIQKLTGEVFNKDIIVDSSVNDKVKDLFTDIDLEGNSLNFFCQETFEEALIDGVVHIHIEYPEIEKRINSKGKVEYQAGENEEGKEKGKWYPFTEKVEKEKGLHPYWVRVEAGNILGCRYKRVKGKLILTQVRIYEVTDEDDDKYGTKQVERVRVLEIGKWTLFKKAEDSKSKDSWIEEKSGKTNLDFIPFVTIMFGEKSSAMTCKPPLEGLAYLNLMHWQSYSDQRNILHYSRMVIYFGKKLTTDEGGKITFGANRLIHTTDKDGDLKVVEHQGHAIGAGREDLTDLVIQMALFGLTQLLPRVGNITATERVLDSKENDSSLKGFVNIFENGITKAYTYTKIMLGEKDDEKDTPFEVNSQFSSVLADYEATVLLAAFEKKLLSREAVIDEFKSRGLINEDLDIIEVLKQLEDEASRITPLSALGGGFQNVNLKPKQIPE